MLVRLARTLLRLFAFLSLLFLWAVVIEPSRLVVREEALDAETWTGPPLRVALISDLHIGSPWIDLNYVQDLVTRTNAATPDLVLLLGDYDINHIRGGEKRAPETWAPILGQLAAPLGVYAVLGNHDWWNDTRRIRSAIEGAGIPVLENTSRVLQWHGRPFSLVGIGDSYSGHDRVKTAFAGVPTNGDTLAMTHDPAVVLERGARADVLVAGHTHGGQVRLPWVTDALLKLPYLRGAYHVGTTDLFVTSGVGTSVYPMRFRVPPEVVLLTITAKADGRVAGS
jgi:hypothetical protein